MNRIDLNQIYRFPPQIMKKWLSVWAARFKTNYDLFKAMSCGKLPYPGPKLIEALCRVTKKKRPLLFPVGGSKIANMKAFPNVHSNNQRSRIDFFDLLRSISIHGYAPLLIFANQLATGLNQDEYSLFH
jgi:hypothetical protein